MHWTYEQWEPNSDLCQGDILEPNEGLSNLFNNVHPHFTKEKYRGFLVITQTCDLVRRKNRGNQCSATHISLSVIRSLQDVICDFLKDIFGLLTPGIYAQDKKRAVGYLIERIVNQNENALGLFYLHPDLDSGISVSSIAILRVSISVRAAEHYHTLEKARVGRLKKEFQPKLGWMIGNLYSRVGVTDWKEKSADKTENIEEIINQEILSFGRKEPVWIDRKVYKKILQRRPDFNSLSSYAQEKLINAFLPPPPKNKVIDIITETIIDAIPQIQPDEIKSIKSHLINNSTLEIQMRKFAKYQ